MKNNFVGFPRLCLKVDFHFFRIYIYIYIITIGKFS
jgi:hypothetical protein